MVGKRVMTAEDFLSVIRRRWIPILALAVAGCALGFVLARILPKRYVSHTTVLVEQPTVPESLVKSVVSDDISQRLASMQQEILSRSRLEPVIEKFGLFREDIDKVPMEELVDRLRKKITVTPILPMAETRARDLPGFNISVTYNTPVLAQSICSTISSLFMEKNIQLRQDQAEQTTDFLAKQLEGAKAKLDDQDAKLAAFKRRYIGSLPDEEQTNLNLLTGLTSQLEATTQALARAQQDKSFAESMLSQQTAAWEATQSGQNPETLDQQLVVLQAQLTTLQARYTDGYPDVIKAKKEIATLRQQIAASEQQKTGPDTPARSAIAPAQIQQLRAQVHQYDQVLKERSVQQEQIQEQIKLYQGRIQSSPGVEQEYKELTRDYQTALDLYNDLLKKRDQSAMATDLEHRQEGEQFRVLDPANLPDAPAFPNRMLFMAGGFTGGLGLGLGLGLLFEMLDSSLRSERDVEYALQLPVLAMLPIIAAQSRRTAPTLVSTGARQGTRA